MTEMPIEIVRSIPPRPSKGRIDWTAVRDALSRAPGAWAKVGPVNPSVATHIRNGRYAAFPDYQRFEVETRRCHPDEIPDEDSGKDMAWLYIRLKG